MTIILFLIDTSASMNQRTFMGTSLIDIAKATVETFMKLRSRDANSRLDRYMLLTFEDPPANVKAGWKESHATFINELKNLQAIGVTNLGPALKNAFDLLNINRMQSGIDTYGQGRCPFYLEPALIVLLTDGGKLVSSNGVQHELNLPMNAIVPGWELTKEPFRWDQRIFGLVLKIPATPPRDYNFSHIPTAENSPLDAMCDVTGGRSYAISSQRMLNAAVESLVQKVQGGVVISFEKFGPDPPSVFSEGGKLEMNFDSNGSAKENQDINRQDLEKDVKPSAVDRKCTPPPLVTNTSWHTCRKLIYVHRFSVGHWPIPEAFWPDFTSATLPPRTAHPVLKFTCSTCDPLVIDNLPFDKYELEPSPLTLFILERRQPNTCWQVFVNNSAKYSEVCHPFGYLKASSNLTCVNLFVMPYNYPVLLPLLDELFKVHKLKPTSKWRQQFDNYLKTMPGYYAGPLKRAFSRMGAPNLVPDNMDNCLSYAVISTLKKLKNQAKVEMDRLIASVGQKMPANEGIQVTSRSKTSILQRKDFRQLLQRVGSNISSLKQEITDYSTFTIAVPDREIRPQYYRNPYDIPRKSLLDQIARMRTNFLKTYFSKTKLVDDDQIHNIPVQQMGNYQEYLKKMAAPLRELESQPTRMHMFGNPFKVNKQNFMIDETEDAMFGGPQPKNKRCADSPPSSPGPRKRKPGPLPKDICIRRPSTPPPGSPHPAAMVAVKSEVTNSKVKPPSPDLHPEVKADPVPPLSMEIVKPEQFIETANHINQTESDIFVKTEKDSISVVDSHKYQKQAMVWTHNTRLRHVLYKEIKRPGRNYENLFTHLNTVQGNLDIKSAFVKDIIREASRFKRRSLIQMLEQFEHSIVKLESKRHRTAQAISPISSR